MPDPQPAETITPPKWPGTAWTCLRLALLRGSYLLVATIAAGALLIAALLTVFTVVDPPGSAVMLWHRLAG